VDDSGSGVIHQEMPKGIKGLMGGFQLWANLPAKHKMMPLVTGMLKGGYTEVTLENGVKVKIICGQVTGSKALLRIL